MIGTMLDMQGIDQLQGAIPATVGAIVGGGLALLGGYLTQLRDSSRRDRDLRREKGEELFVTAAQWDKRLFTYMYRRGSVITGKLTYNQVLDLEIADGKENKTEFDRVQMLIHVYFPETRSAYDRMIAARDKVNEVITEHKQAYEKGDRDGRSFHPQFCKQMDEFIDAREALRLAIISAIRSI